MNVEGLCKQGYMRMLPVEETLASYLSQSEAPLLKAPILSSKLLQTTLRLIGKAYVAVGQAGGALHTMAVLKAYQADLLRDLDQGQGLSLKAVAELCCNTDLTCHATKHTSAIRCQQWYLHRGIYS